MTVHCFQEHSMYMVSSQQISLPRLPQYLNTRKSRMKNPSLINETNNCGQLNKHRLVNSTLLPTHSQRSISSQVQSLARRQRRQGQTLLWQGCKWYPKNKEKRVCNSFLFNGKTPTTAEKLRTLKLHYSRLTQR